MVDTELAWQLADTAHGHLDASRRNEVYIAIAVGDAFWAVKFLLQTIVRSELAVRADVEPKLSQWAASYRDHPEQAQLRNLIGRVRVQPFDPPRAVPAPPRVLATTSRYKQPIRRVRANLRSVRTAARLDRRVDSSQLSQHQQLIDDVKGSRLLTNVSARPGTSEGSRHG